MPILGGGASTRAGTMQAWPSNTIPSGWLKCNGAAVSRTLYAALFNEIGTTYGAPDAATFNLPDMRGEFLRGLDDGRGVDSGRTIGSSQAADIANHAHLTPVGAYDGNFSGPRISNFRGNGDTGSINTGFFGGSETRPRNRAMHFIIKF